MAVRDWFDWLPRDDGYVRRGKSWLDDSEYDDSLSGFWSSWRWRSTSYSWHDHSLMLHDAKSAIIGLCNSHYFVPDLQVFWAREGMNASDMNGHKIALDAAVLISAPARPLATHSERLDVISGLALHEIQHIRESDSFEWKDYVEKKWVNLWNAIRNLLEDERIELLFADQSPGFVRYLEEVKRYMFKDYYEKNKPPVTKLLILLLFVRYPSMLGVLPKETLEAYSEFIEGVKDYLTPFDRFDSGESIRHAATEILRRFFDDDDVEMMNDSSGIEGWDGEDDAIDLSNLEVIYVMLGGSVPSDGVRIRIGPDTRIVVTGVHESPKEELDSDTAEETARLDSGEIEKKKSKETATSGLTSLGSEIFFLRGSALEPFIGRRESDFLSALSEVNAVYPRLRFKFKLRASTSLDIREVRERLHGRFDRRKIAAAAAGDRRVYRTRVIERRHGVTVVLLVDASGSMGGLKMRMADKTAAALYLSLRENELVKLWLYAHTADNFVDVCTVLFELSTPDLPLRRVQDLLGFPSMAENRDGVAITSVAEHVDKLTPRNGAKYLIHVSDGLPSADGYRGTAAVDHTKQSVRKIELNGWEVWHIWIGPEGEMPKIYRHNVELGVMSLDRLPQCVSHLAQKMVMRATTIVEEPGG